MQLKGPEQRSGLCKGIYEDENLISTSRNSAKERQSP